MDRVVHHAVYCKDGSRNKDPTSMNSGNEESMKSILKCYGMGIGISISGLCGAALIQTGCYADEPDPVPIQSSPDEEKKEPFAFADFT
jgi:hypothetical protein